MTTAKQRAWRAKFAAMYGGKKKTSRKTRVRGVKMARKRSFKRSSGGLGSLLSGKGKIGAMLGMGIIGSIAGGYIGGMIAEKILPSVPLAKVAGGFIGGGALGAGAVYLMPNLPNQVLSGVGTATSSSANSAY